MTMTVSTGKTGKGCISDDGKEMLGRQRIRRALFNRRKRRGGKKERKKERETTTNQSEVAWKTK